MRRHRPCLALVLLVAHLAFSAGCSGGSESTVNPFVSLGAEDAYEQGVARRRAGDYAGAEAAFRRSIEVNPRYLAAYLGLGRTLNEAGRNTEALAVYDEALTIRSSSGEGHWGRAVALLALERYDDAIAAANVAADNGYREDAILVLALAFEHTGDMDGAISMLEEVLRGAPSRTDVRIQLSRMYLAQGRARDAVPLLERAAFSDTEDVTAWTALADLYSQLDMYDRASEAWQQVARMDRGRAYPLMRQGEAQLEVGNHMVAIQVLSDAITLDPTVGEAYILRGRAQLAGAFLDRALADAERALALDPQNPEALDLIAEVHSRRGSVSDAIAAYEEMLATRPDDMRTAIALARIHLENANPTAALQVLEPFTDQAVDNPALTETLFTAHHRLNHDDQALDYLAHYVNARPNDPILLLELVETALALPAQTRLRSGELVTYAERALELTGGFRTEYRLALIDALIADGQRERALEETLRALDDVPNNPDLRERRRQLE